MSRSSLIILEREILILKLLSLYEAFANQETNNLQNYPDFGHAVLRHRQIEEIYNIGTSVIPKC